MNDDRGNALDFSKIPKSPRWPIFGSVPYLMWAGGEKQFHNYIENVHNQVGPIFMENLGQGDALFVSDAEANSQVFRHEGKHPVHVTPEAWTLYCEQTGRKRGLFFMDGEEWAEKRKILHKILTKTVACEENLKLIVEATDTLVECWKKNPPGEKLEENMYCWNLDCIGSIVVGKPLEILNKVVRESESNEECEEKHFVKAVHSIFKESANLLATPLTLARFIGYFGYGAWRRFQDGVTTALEISKKYILNGIEESEQKYQNESDDSDERNNMTIIDGLFRQNIDSEMIVRLSADLILASADTTALTAVWAMYVLGRNPEIANKAREEIREILEDGSIDSKSLNNLHYLGGILKEVIRLYPMAPFLSRRLDTDAVLYGYNVPAGTFVIPSVFSMCRNPKYFSDPLEVRPERWFSDQTKNSSEPIPTCTKSAYIPWAIGIRSCIGRKLAEKELMVLLTRLLQNFEWTVEEEVPPVMRMVMMPSKDFVLRLRPIS